MAVMVGPEEMAEMLATVEAVQAARCLVRVDLVETLLLQEPVEREAMVETAATEVSLRAVQFTMQGLSHC